ncbi:hypothetical protein [Bathymodiolus thermophilus thioautotrophic gill symbiont]|uniref:Uncharacterized protein n=1 Tax=Bathymodiolus thermophilus thioautotrophic gill symbiont TaxID=2360 RepID=A0A1J5U9E4_9GAMM|nr:hypothetical protein [Bathymodiolus thermophilus thioautotrophic gill symbiont]OIR25462.1 hypothetical protein BGC33_13425 [Bathymodiolus thermophilus thioautotrophic gill symbiont]
MGFEVERPETKYGGKGGAPDVIWLLNDDQAFIIEVKSKKKSSNPFTKEELGQLLASTEWFKKEYSNYNYHSVSLHPSIYSTKNTTTDDVYILTLDKLNVLISNCHQLFNQLCNSEIPKQQLLSRCTSLLEEYDLTADKLPVIYLQKFQ